MTKQGVRTNMVCIATFQSAKGALQTRSPVRSSRMQKSPLRMVTSRQSLSRSGRLRTDKTREISMSPVPKFQAPANSPNQSPATSPTPHVLGKYITLSFIFLDVGWVYLIGVYVWMFLVFVV